MKKYRNKEGLLLSKYDLVIRIDPQEVNVYVQM